MNEGAVGALILYGCGKGAVPLPHCGSDGNRGLILFREVNDLIWTPEASTLFGLCFLRFCRVIPAVLLAKNADVSGPDFTRSLRGKVLDLDLLGRGRAFLGCRRCTLRQADRQKSAVPRLKISKKLTFVDLNS